MGRAAARAFVAAALLAAVAGAARARAGRPPRPRVSRFQPPGGHPGSASCAERWRTATLDHFSWAQPPEGAAPPEGAEVGTFKQRFFVCDRDAKPGGPILFYCGNEADVELYVNATGLMWETAPELGATLVFAEHRYYGKSLPFADLNATTRHMAWLTSEQALADYAELVSELRAELKDPARPVVGFGGSYGGMLASWFRIKYPHAVDGVVAGSAPIWSFLDEQPPADAGSYAAIVTRDFGPEGGASAGAPDNMRAAWAELLARGGTEEGRASLSRAFRLCPGQPLASWDDVYGVAFWLQSAFDFMAMGNFPYASSYILNGHGVLPPFPMRVASAFLGGSSRSGDALLDGLREAAGVFYNYTHDLKCFNYTSGVNPQTQLDGEFWDYQYCTEMWQPMERDGKRDMFWPQPFDAAAAKKQCIEEWNVSPRTTWATTSFGGKRLQYASNIVFSNGELDPWSGTGVLHNVSSTVVAVVIEGGAHHLDLMWSNPEDPPSVLAARATERAHIRRWVAEAEARR